MRLYKQIIVGFVTLALAGQFTALAARESADGELAGAQAQTPPAVYEPRVGIIGGSIDEQLIENARPMVDKAPEGLFITAPYVNSLIVMNVRVYNDNGELVMNARSVGEPLDLMATDLPDGEYRYEAVTVFLLDEPIGQGADYTDEGISRNFGNFTISGDTLIKDARSDPRNQPVKREEASVLERVINQATYLAGVTLDFLIPSAQAQNLTAASTTPLLTYDDTNSGGSAWRVNGDGGFGDYRILDYIGANTGHTVLDINGSAGSSLNTNAFVVDADGDLHWGNGLMHLDKGFGTLSLGWMSTDTAISVSEATPDIRLHDSSDNSESEWELSNGVVRFWGRPLSSDPFGWRAPIRYSVNAPGDSLEIGSTGLVNIGGSINTIGTILKVGNSGSSRSQVELQSADGSTYIEYGQIGNSLQFESTGGGTIVEFDMSAPTYSLRIASSGNVGFGTTSAPTEAVDVVRSSAASRFQLTSYSSTGNQAAQFIQRRSRGTSGAPTAIQSGDNLGLFSFRGYNGNAMSGTKAGITAKATQNWNGGANGTRLLFQTTQNGTTALNTVMEITHDGKVKINGTTLNVPDYVFEDAYQLMSLDDLSAYVKENKHLPGVASADEVKSDGLDLAGSQLSVLEKVEELTLYTLQQHEALKELETLKAENAQLKAAFQALQERGDRLEQMVGLLMQRQENDHMLTALN